eukprot:s20_g58.t1
MPCTCQPVLRSGQQRSQSNRTLRLQVSLPSGRRADISLSARKKVSCLKQAAQRALGCLPLSLADPDGRRLDPSQTLISSGLRDGDCVAAVRHELQIAATSKAFAAWAHGCREVVAWGCVSAGADCPIVSDRSTEVQMVWAGQKVFVASFMNGDVVSWGNTFAGGDSSKVQSELKFVEEVVFTCNACAARLANGKVVTWGSESDGGDSSAVQAQLIDVKKVVSTCCAFAALLPSQRIVSWGSPDDGGYIPPTTQDMLTAVKDLTAACHAFAALLHNGSVVTWGSSAAADISKVQMNLLNVEKIYSTSFAFAAHRSNGTVVAWGDPAFGGDNSAVNSELIDVKSLHTTGKGFAALRPDGTIVRWGDMGCALHMRCPHIEQDAHGNLVFAHHSYTAAACAVQKNDGTVTTWGCPWQGGDDTAVKDKLHNIRGIVSTDHAFAAISAQGHVVTWGHEAFGGASQPSMRPWPKQLPHGKQRKHEAAQSKKTDIPTRPAASSGKATVPLAPATRSKKRKVPAAAPAASQPPQRKKVRSSMCPRITLTETCAVAQRLAAGRTGANYLVLQDTALLSNCDKERIIGILPVRGVTATWHGDDVLILDSFVRRGCPKNDVAILHNLQPDSADRWVLGQVSTCSSSELCNLRLEHEVVDVIRGRVFLQRFQQPAADPACAVHRMQKKADEAFSTLLAPKPGWVSSSAEPLELRTVQPKEAKDHESQFPTHQVGPRPDRQRFEFCLDVPTPQIWDVTPWRCRTCASETWHVTSADVDDECVRRGLARMIRHEGGKHGKLRASPLLLFWLLLMLYSNINVRAVRRKLLDLYSASVLRAAQMTPSLSEAAQLRWILTCIPDHHAIRDVLLSCFADFVQKRVELMQERQFVYNGQLIRGDGNYDLAKAVSSVENGKKVHKYSVALGWCGVDGSLLAPISLARAESWPCLHASLAPLLRKIKQARLRAGLSLEESLPCFHATDSYHKHRVLISKLYSHVWQDLRVEGEAATRCKDAFGKVAIAKEDDNPTKWHLRVTGEPMHDLFALRRLTSPAANDCRNFLKDHEDMILRLSAPPAPTDNQGKQGDGFDSLTHSSQDLLKACVTEATETVAAKLANAPGQAQELREFLSSENVQKHSVWHLLFHSAPPRGVLVRLAKRLQTPLHNMYGFFNFTSKADFLEEVERMESWYKKPKRGTRRRRGILRSEKGPDEIKGRATVWTAKVAAHYSRLRAPVRMQGLLRWRDAALCLHSAGIQTHSGTIPVERLWANICNFFAKEATNISEPWWVFVSNLAFLRFNYRHFHKQGLPAWAREDTLVFEQVESIMKLAEATLFGGQTSLSKELASWATSFGASQPAANHATAADHMQEAERPPPIYCRVLHKEWCDALASGDKFFEAQAYKTGRLGNFMKFACEDVWVLFGEAGHQEVAGAALVAGPKTRLTEQADFQERVQTLPEYLQGPFEAYIDGAAALDIIDMKMVYDLRPLSLTWDRVSTLLKCKVSRNVGFTNVRCTEISAWQDFSALLLDERVQIRTKRSRSAAR